MLKEMLHEATWNVEQLALLGSIGLGLIILSIISWLVIKRLPKRVKAKKFRSQWRELQKLCAHKETWREAILAADNLLDAALRKRSVKGKTMGERLVNAQRFFTDNDALWFAHKLSNKLEVQPKTRLQQDDVMDALVGFQRALKDLGAL